MQIGKLSSLQQLHLSHNQLSLIPHSLGLLHNLTVLNVSNNRLTFLPDSIGYLRSLQSLQASNNELTELPETVGKLLFLSKLNVSWNQLKAFPATLVNLERLEDIRAGHNSITEIPADILQLPRLCVFDVQANPLPAATLLSVSKFATERDRFLIKEKASTSPSLTRTNRGEPNSTMKALSYVTPFSRLSSSSKQTLQPLSPFPNLEMPASRVVTLLHSPTLNMDRSLSTHDDQGEREVPAHLQQLSHTNTAEMSMRVKGLEKRLESTTLILDGSEKGRVHHAY